MAQTRTGNFVFVGGTHGIGKATAKAVAKTGSSILLIARDATFGEAVAAELRAEGAQEAVFMSSDLSTVAGMAAAADGILNWKSQLHGIQHSAMSAFNRKTLTPDGLELAFALQYLARAVINRSCKDALAASGDGRIVHIAGGVSRRTAPPVLDDLQFEHRKWSFLKSVLPTHVMGFEFLDEAARRWADEPISLYASVVGSTKTKAMQDPAMPLIMRLIGLIGTSPEKSAGNAIRLLLDVAPPKPTAALFAKPTKFIPTPFNVPRDEADRLWGITSSLAAAHGRVLA